MTEPTREDVIEMLADPAFAADTLDELESLRTQLAIPHFSEYERIAHGMCRDAGCRCSTPLLGWTDYHTPRCRLCNVEVPAGMREAEPTQSKLIVVVPERMDAYPPWREAEPTPEPLDAVHRILMGVAQWDIYRKQSDVQAFVDDLWHELMHPPTPEPK